HELSDFQDGKERIIVLKIRAFSKTKIEEQQRLKKNLENKKKKPIYTGYDDEEFNFTIKKKKVRKKVADNDDLSRMSVEEIARNLTNIKEEPYEDDKMPGEGLVISDISEFVKSLIIAPIIIKPVEIEPKPIQL
ncbi:14687_t:CDS:2, partial [Funneliformis mosseae]